MGFGAAYLGLVDLLSNFGTVSPRYSTIPLLIAIFVENCTEPESVIQCLIGFVSETSIQSIKRATDDNIASWYHAVR